MTRHGSLYLDLRFKAFRIYNYMVTITFDSREHGLYDLFCSFLPPNEHENIHIQQKPLEIGDILIENESPDVRLIFERKTENDLLASIKDGRYREQKLRMTHTYPAHNCTYLIESPHGWKSYHQNNVFQGALYHSMYRDKIHVVVLSSIRETALWLIALLSKVKDHPEKFANTSESTQVVNYIEHTKVKKKKIENVDRDACYTLQWCQIPGISAKIAQQIVATYPSWREFLQDMEACNTEDERVKKLCSIPMVGEKKARTILAFM